MTAFADRSRSQADDRLRTVRRIAWARWVAVLDSAILIPLLVDNPHVEHAPGPISKPALWAMTLVLAAYNLVATFWLPHIFRGSQRAAEWVIALLVVGDVLIGSGWMLLLSNNHFNTSFALFSILALEVAVTYPRRWRVTALFLVVYIGMLSASRAIGVHYGFAIHIDEILFRTFTIAILCGLTGLIVRDRENLKDELELQSLTDALTGLGNRRALDLRLAEEIVRADRFAYPLTVLLADVDHFKVYNDTHGHRAGDDILRAIGRVLRSQALRQGTDHAYRYGGEEFLVLLPGSESADALEVAERLRAAIESETATLRLPRGAVPVTVSVGVAVYPRDARSGDEVVQHADLALYRAKETRNCAIAYTPEVTLPPATKRDGTRAATG